MNAASGLVEAMAPAAPKAASRAAGVPVQEQAWCMPCGEDHLLGVFSEPAAAASEAVAAAPGAPATSGRLGALIVVGGPQYRAGSHRQFVHWARALAAGGVPTLRFDVRGMGDSSGAQRAFTDLSEDIGAAIDALLAHRPDLDGVALCALCDGASAALLYLHERRDPRIAALVLLNPWVRSDQTLARTMVRHYYLQRLLDRGFWAKLLRGQVAAKAVRELWGHLRQARQGSPGATSKAGDSGPGADAHRPYQDRMALALQHNPRPMLLVLCGEDYTAKEFIEHTGDAPLWRSVLEVPGVQRLDLPTADHTLSAAADRATLHQASLAWLADLAAPGKRRSGGRP